MPAILVIENDDLEMEFIRSIIQQELGRKYALLAARTGAQGLRFARQNHPEIVLMDVLLPDMADARKTADQLEALSDKRSWPFPTYSELLFSV